MDERVPPPPPGRQSREQRDAHPRHDRRDEVSRPIVRIAIFLVAVLALGGVAVLLFSKGCAAEKPVAPPRPEGAYSAPPAIPEADEPPPDLSYVDVAKA